MREKRTLFVAIIAALSLVCGAVVATAADADFISGLDLTKEQINKLGKIVGDFSDKRFSLEAKIDSNRLALAQELRKADRWNSEAKLKASSRIVNKHVKALVSLGGDLMKLKVAYFLKAKDVFTDDQRLAILSALTDYDMDLPDNFSYYLELDLPALDLDLTDQQVKKLLKYRAEMEIRTIQYALDIDYKALDLKAELFSEKRNPKKVNKIISSLANTGTKIINNKIDHILRAKDVLTLEQKMALFQMVLLIPQ